MLYDRLPNTLSNINKSFVKIIFKQSLSSFTKFLFFSKGRRFHKNFQSPKFSCFDANETNPLFKKKKKKTFSTTLNSSSKFQNTWARRLHGDRQFSTYVNSFFLTKVAFQSLQNTLSMTNEYFMFLYIYKLYSTFQTKLNLILIRQTQRFV